ncbi:discoidin domain-containing protein [Paractinoplanes toevensis]|uniref:F5/8 type C domain-containing protein n=1 Tax=Paractinoplanes toevensis TaxID=571911 RepID=A0A919W9P7_9ACTN|nr:hypothetical protein Ato02nite_079920 [Actinoplanes toevensis]
MRHAIPRRRPRLVTAALGALLLLLAGAYAAIASGAAHAADTLLSQGRPATSSSTENGSFPASAAVDGNTGTRWSSAFGDPQWLQVDLGATATITSVTLNWEAASAKSFQIQTSANGSTWTTIYSTTTGAGGVQTLAVSGSGRYVRMNGTVRATPYGYSLWEFQVFGSSTGTPPTTPPSGGSTMPDSFWGDTGGIPAAHNVVEVKVLNRTNGKYPDSQVYWNFNGQTHSIAEQPYLDMPANSAGRMYFYLGSPTSQYYDFIEFTTPPPRPRPTGSWHRAATRSSSPAGSIRTTCPRTRRRSGSAPPPSRSSAARGRSRRTPASARRSTGTPPTCPRPSSRR